MHLHIENDVIDLCNANPNKSKVSLWRVSVYEEVSNIHT